MKRYDMGPWLRRWLPWLMSAGVSLIAIGGWASSLDWQFDHLSTYQLFPLFGLLAFSILWSQYVVVYLGHHHLPGGLLTTQFFGVTGYVVLGLILLHPSLLVMQLFVDGFGLPPGSYVSYVGPMGALAVLVGSLSLLLFLSFELGRYARRFSWWRWVTYAVDAAMIGIVYHSLTLGTQLQTLLWLRAIWYIYAIVLVYTLVDKYLRLHRHRGE